MKNEMINKDKFTEELKDLINRYSYDTFLELPDYMIAQMLVMSLESFITIKENTEDQHE